MRLANTVAASSILALAHGAKLGERALSGEATFYGGNVAGGTCSFSTFTLPAGVFGTALSDSNWDSSANCGACVSVTGPNGNAITAMIVDQCPGCGRNHLDLFPDAFSALADPSKGIIPITWDYVDCPITSPLAVHNKEGVSAFWFSMQVVNANKGVSSLEVSTNGGSTWKPTTRQQYNFFENSSGFGTTVVDVKVTSEDGDVVVLKRVNVVAGALTTASSNFGYSSSAAPSVKTAALDSSTTSSSEAVPATTDAPVSTSLPAAVFNETSFTASPISDESTTTRSSTTTVTRTRTVSKSTYTPAPTPSSTSSSTTTLTSMYSPATSYLSSNTTSALVAATASASSNVSLSVITVTTCISTVMYSVVPVSTSTPIAILTGTIYPVQNTSVPSPTAPPAIVNGGAASLIRSSAFMVIFAGAVAYLIV
ncbi:RlpA-like double-psi beta-barrel-protein domain-containing protein-containing protein [Rhexocercosporidium sp. MPI-PUGE-AT-0058]|nr:RlpA-like double-psi beta-barrel-protein domain-containing protein-containing protein [Rhexocercosporidium sp. MPI-PUGE-AT-0058]